VRQPRRSLCANLDVRTYQQRSDGRPRSLEDRNSSQLQAGELHRGGANTEAQHRTPVRDLVDRRNRTGRDGRMPRDRVGQQRTEADSLRRLGSEREQYVGIVAAQLGIRDKSVVPPGGLGARDIGSKVRRRREVEALQAERWRAHPHSLFVRRAAHKFLDSTTRATGMDG